MQDKLEVCIKDWAELADEYKELELRHKEYREVWDYINSSLLHSNLCRPWINAWLCKRSVYQGSLIRSTD